MKFDFLPCTVTLDIEYINAAKELSQRTIDVNKFSTDYVSGRLSAYCNKSESFKTFKYSGIRACINTETGEVIAASDVGKYIFEIYKADPRSQIDFFLYDHRCIIDIFSYLVKVDAKALRIEREVILKWLFDQSGLSSEDFSTYAESLIKKWEVPADEGTYLQLLRNCREAFPELVPEIILAAEQIIHADNKVHENEMKAFELMKFIFID